MFWNRKKNNEDEELKLKENLREMKKWIIIIFFSLGIILLIIAFIFDKIKKEKENHDLDKYDQGIAHEDYSPDLKKDPFLKKENIKTTIGNITFKRPESLEDFIEPNTDPTILDKNSENILFSTYFNQPYIYNFEDNQRHIIGNDITKIAVCDNKDYLAYISYYQYNMPKVMSYTVNLGSTYELFTAPLNYEITNIICDNQRVFVTIKDTNNEISTKSIPLNTSVKSLRLSERNIKVPNSGEFLLKNKNGVYVYMPKSKTLKVISYLEYNAKNIPIIINDQVKELLQININDNNDWLAVFYDEKLKLKLSINGEKMRDYKNILFAKWYDNNHVLINDTNTLYIYDTITKAEEVLKTDVSNFIVSDGDVYFHDGSGKLFKLEKEQD